MFTYVNTVLWVKVNLEPFIVTQLVGFVPSQQEEGESVGAQYTYTDQPHQ